MQGGESKEDGVKVGILFNPQSWLRLMPRWSEQEERDTEGFGGNGKALLNDHWTSRRQACQRV